MIRPAFWAGRFMEAVHAAFRGRAGVAQRLEQRSVKLKMLRSIRAAGTAQEKAPRRRGLFY